MREATPDPKPEPRQKAAASRLSRGPAANAGSGVTRETRSERAAADAKADRSRVGYVRRVLLASYPSDVAWWPEEVWAGWRTMVERYTDNEVKAALADLIMRSPDRAPTLPKFKQRLDAASWDRRERAKRRAYRERLDAHDAIARLPLSDRPEGGVSIQ